MSSTLTSTEVTLLKSYESVIEKGLSTFYEVGSALLQIRDCRLYRTDHKTFEAYCEKKWQIARRTAYQLMEAASVVDDVRHGAQTPHTERQARPLSSIPREARAEAWQHAVDTAPTNDADEPIITAKHVEKAVKEWKAEREPKPAVKPSGPAIPDTSGFDELTEAIKSLVSSAGELHGTPAGKFLNIKLVRSLGNQLKKLFAEARPVAICPYCEGRKCSICARTGAVTREIHSQYTPEGK